jgi:threonylcarbamoyladenosine tRNA methylthiotransferase MtaB
MARFCLTTIGCKVNQYDSAALAEALKRLGLLPVEGPQAADLAVIHTCCVTTSAMHKGRSAIRRALRRWPEAAVLVTGCYADYDAQAIRRVAGDFGLPDTRLFVAGNQSDLPAVLRQISQSLVEQCGGTSMPKPGGFTRLFRNDPCMSAGKSCREAASPMHVDIKARRRAAVKRNITPNSFLPPISSFPGHQRAFLKVQDGCDAFCSYCVVPYTRPVLWSRPIEQVRRQCLDLLAGGHREIVLSGIFLGAYGRQTALRRKWEKTEGRGARGEERNSEERKTERTDRSRNSGCLLPELVRTIRELPGLWRLRLSSLEPLDLTEDLLDACNHPAVAPHFHLPLQSGSGKILARMNRQYTPEQYRQCVDRLRQAIPRVAVTTDVIVGFPGETEDDFDRTLEMAAHAGFSNIHAFPFSAIEGTAAWLWRNQAPPPPVVKERMARLSSLEQHLAGDFRKQFVGETIEAIVELPSSRTSPATAMTDRHITIYVTPTREARKLTGQVVRVRTDALHKDGLSGRLEPTAAPRHPG